eukprot:2986682-Prymnesium_polylepis.1
MPIVKAAKYWVATSSHIHSSSSLPLLPLLPLLTLKFAEAAEMKRDTGDAAPNESCRAMSEPASSVSGQNVFCFPTQYLLSPSHVSSG